MEPLITRLTPVLHLTRITTAFGAVANVWLIILWSRAESSEHDRIAPVLLEDPVWVLLVGGTAMAIGLFAFGTALNDTIDVRRDRALNPNRPIAAGQLSVEAALGWTLGALLVAVLGAAALGVPAVIMCLGTASAIMLYNVALRFFPSIGLVLLGMIYGAHMIAANVYLDFVWPVWLSMTHALFAACVIHHLSGARPALTGRTLLFAILGYVFWASILIVVGWRRMDASLWPDAVPWTASLWVIALASAFALLAWRKARGAGSSKAAAEKVQRYAALWLALYAAGWMFGADHVQQGVILAVLAAVGFLGMTILRELYGLLEQPIGYRR